MTNSSKRLSNHILYGSLRKTLTEGRKVCHLHLSFSVCDIFDPDTPVSNFVGWC